MRFFDEHPVIIIPFAAPVQGPVNISFDYGKIFFFDVCISIKENGAAEKKYIKQN